MSKAKTTMGRSGGGGDIIWKLDDMAGVLQQGVLGFKAKANPKRPTIFRICPEVENGVIEPMRLDDDGSLSRFFEKVTVAEMGGAKSGAKYTSFICDPSDAADDMPRSEYPTIKLKAFMDEAANSNPEWLHPYLNWFSPHGQYNSIGFPWPGTFLCVQGFSYQQPGCNIGDVVEKAAGRLANHPKFGYVMNNPAGEFKIMFIKGGGAEAMENMFLGRKSDESDEFLVPAAILHPGNPLAIQVTGGKEETEDGERTAYYVNPFDLKANGCWIPDEAAIKSNFKPWDKVFRKISYNEQMQKLVNLFSPDLINRCFGSVIEVQNSAPAAATAAAEPAAAAGGWGGEAAAPAAAEPVAEKPAAEAGGWGGETAAPAAEKPAAEPAAAGGWGDGVANAAEGKTGASAGGALSNEELEDRFSKYKDGDKK